MSYTVWHVLYHSMPDDHMAIFVETDKDKSGRIFHVTGSIQLGMAYVTSDQKSPEESLTYNTKHYLGKIDAGSLEAVDTICRRIDVPGKQFDGNKMLVPRSQLRNCQHWTKDAISALQASGMIKK
ncbi:hypothetical protein D6D10_09668 [Aureobasidium pullulans]|uniref:Uncharacterized protein n=1 Tax=Aureobasidium pullulans TaxID=5580 RepID=A0A4S9DYW8_AURPU|nr:hypothetical protein D6D10_09668 [Aureobasidium pullulans]